MHEAAVVGAPDLVLGEVPVAHVALLPGAEATSGDLVTHCAGQLARITIPTRITIVDAVPKNPVGKIDKPMLRRAPAPAG